jgi:hypothetical protein
MYCCRLALSSGLLCDSELMGFLGHTITTEVVSGSKPHLKTYKVEGIAPYINKGQQWNELHWAWADKI